MTILQKDASLGLIPENEHVYEVHEITDNLTRTFQALHPIDPRCEKRVESVLYMRSIEGARQAKRFTDIALIQLFCSIDVR